MRNKRNVLFGGRVFLCVWISLLLWWLSGLLLLFSTLATTIKALQSAVMNWSSYSSGRLRVPRSAS